MLYILYSQKYWRELNLVVEPKIAITRILVDLIGTGSPYVYMRAGFGGYNTDHQTAKF